MRLLRYEIMRLFGYDIMRPYTRTDVKYQLLKNQGLMLTVGCSQLRDTNDRRVKSNCGGRMLRVG